MSDSVPSSSSSLVGICFPHTLFQIFCLNKVTPNKSLIDVEYQNEETITVELLIMDVIEVSTLMTMVVDDILEIMKKLLARLFDF